jgi:hypothetical protein
MLPRHNAARVTYTIQTVMKSAKFLPAYSHTFVVPPLQIPCLSQTENLKIKIYTSTLLSYLFGRGTWSITLTEEQGLEAIKDINIAVNITYYNTFLILKSLGSIPLCLINNYKV